MIAINWRCKRMLKKYINEYWIIKKNQLIVILKKKY